MESIFTKIINNELPSFKVYEDKLVIVILDINPNTNGHMLVIPKEHIITIEELNNDLLLHINKVIVNMKKIIFDKLDAKGLTVVLNNNYGQEVKHMHFHLIPRYENDEFYVDTNKSDIKDLEDIHNKLIN